MKKVYIALGVAAVLSSCKQKQAATAELPVDSLSESSNVEGKLVDYNFDIRPILSDKCFFCHGPDEKNNKAGFRLDTAEAAFAALKESKGHGIVAGNLEKSEVWQRIITKDPGDVMPPPETKLTLTQKEQDLIAAWIKQGAEYKPHWAFLDLPKTVKVPVVKGNWASQPIDKFILRRLEEVGLEHSAEAAPERWLRRATFDLTGLPPTVSEVENFLATVKNEGEAAYVNVVDGLLERKSYGEHQAVAWLDAARYSDSYGFQSDLLSVNWPYRDWVVKAFNDNLPYNTFLTWQLAGDLVKNPTKETRLATAYNRLHRLTNEGGSVREEFLVENASDRLHTFGTSVIALTMECTRCHDHKYDPITQKDYFSLSGFFNSIPEEGLYSHSAIIPAPSLLLPNQQQAKKLAALKTEIEAIEKQYSEEEAKEVGQAQQWASLNNAINPVDLVGDFRFDEGKSIKNYAGKNVVNGIGQVFVDRAGGKAIGFNGDKGLVFTSYLDFDRHSPFTYSLDLKDTLRGKEQAVILQKTHGTDVGYNGLDLVIQEGIVSARLYRVWPGNGIGVRALKPLAKDQWQNLTWTYDGSSKAAGMKLYLNGELLEVEEIGTRLKKSTNIHTYRSGNLTLGQRFRDRGFKGGFIDSFKIYDRAITPLEVALIAHPKLDLTKVKLKDKKAYYYSAISPRLRAIKAKLKAKHLELVKTEEGVVEVSVMEELKTPRPSYILDRGDYNAKKTPDKLVSRGAFEHILKPFGKELPQNRLGLAQWVTDPDHPLTARVYVNRVWQSFFGVGIVKSSENFGLQGDLPTHPDLLNWLARDFVSHHWDTKRLCKSIVLSKTYRQDSKLTAKLKEIDPENKWLARGPAYRLGAEQIRDMALATSGLLSKKMGGRPVSPYQPGKDLWRDSNAFTASYRQGKGQDLYRRSLYSVWKRTAPLPNMMAFDATSREVCVVSRERNNTPLQALVLLNDVQFVEAARGMASQLLLAKLADDEARIKRAFLKLTGRKVTAKELVILKQIYAEQRTHYATRAEDAKKLCHQGESKPPASIDFKELAAFTTVCQTIFNLDATILRR